MIMRKKSSMIATTRLTRRIAVALGLALAAAGAAQAGGIIGTTFPADFPVPVDDSLLKPVIGGAPGPVVRTPVIFLHGNNDTPFPTGEPAGSCSASRHIQRMAQYFADNGYFPGELWALGYQGDQCDLVASTATGGFSIGTDTTLRSSAAHTNAANVPDLRNFVGGARLYRRQAGGHRRPRHGRDARARMGPAGRRGAEGAALRRHRRTQPRHDHLLGGGGQPLGDALQGRLHAREPGLPGTRLAQDALPLAPEPHRSSCRHVEHTGGPEHRRELPLHPARRASPAGRRLGRRDRWIPSANRPTSTSARIPARRNSTSSDRPSTTTSQTGARRTGASPSRPPPGRRLSRS